MKFTVQVRIEDSGAQPLTLPIHTSDRPCAQVQDVGLAFEDAKTILAQLQQALVRAQLERYLIDHRKGQFNLRRLPPRGQAAPAIWNAVLSA
ncbi:hypothetical protein [Variovorax sp. J22R115]|uniref:hypothetical protein n=1 Tax=Variovorax sp. J22R115 TaxID=3053509 RepID=UPI002577DC66|nr:hypothetical protein [Variovorax sp. J22R115]MDM0053785.1 hypothetical protein [Variovorax sp. J22R115]